MSKIICLLPGDGIGPEILAQGHKCLEAIAKKFNRDFIFEEALIGGAAHEVFNTPLPPQTIEKCKKADALYLGAVGGPQWDHLPPSSRVEQGILGLRKEFHLFANLRPASLWPELKNSCLLKPEIADKGIDLIIVRELTGDIYFGEPRGIEIRNGLRTGFNTMLYNEEEIKRIAKIAFETAMLRRKKVCSIDKSNVLETSRLWREVVENVHKDYPEIELEHMYVDNAAMQLVVAPSRFDVILTGNIFGDILSDEAAVITGSIGLLPSASLGAEKPGLYEPIHGSAPDIAGKDIANPLATIMAGAMLLRIGLSMPKEADCLENAIRETLKAGYRTQDIMVPGKTLVSCSEMGEEVAKRI